MQTFRCVSCIHNTWPRGCLANAHRPPWPKGFTQLRFSSLGEYISSQSSDPLIRWLPIIRRGLETQCLWWWFQVGQRPYGQLSPWPLVWSMRVSWFTRLSVCLWFFMASCSTFQINRQNNRGIFRYFWASWVLSPSWIFLGGIWKSNGSACGYKPGYTSCTIPKVPRLTTYFPYPSSWACLLPHIFRPPPNWWGFGMGSLL